MSIDSYSCLHLFSSDIPRVNSAYWHQKSQYHKLHLLGFEIEVIHIWVVWQFEYI